MVQRSPRRDGIDPEVGWNATPLEPKWILGLVVVVFFNTGGATRDPPTATALSNVTASSAGENLTLPCRCEGCRPKHQCCWTQNGSAIQTGDRRYRYETHDDCGIRIVDLKPKDAGTWICSTCATADSEASVLNRHRIVVVPRDAGPEGSHEGSPTTTVSTRAHNDVEDAPTKVLTPATVASVTPTVLITAMVTMGVVVIVVAIVTGVVCYLNKKSIRRARKTPPRLPSLAEPSYRWISIPAPDPGRPQGVERMVSIVASESDVDQDTLTYLRPIHVLSDKSQKDPHHYVNAPGNHLYDVIQ